MTRKRKEATTIELCTICLRENCDGSLSDVGIHKPVMDTLEIEAHYEYRCNLCGKEATMWNEEKNFCYSLFLLENVYNGNDIDGKVLDFHICESCLELIKKEERITNEFAKRLSEIKSLEKRLKLSVQRETKHIKRLIGYQEKIATLAGVFKDFFVKENPDKNKETKKGLQKTLE